MGPIMLAVAFDDRLEDHLKTAVGLAKLLRAPLRLVTVVESWTAGPLVRTVAKVSAASADALDAAMQRLAGTRLDELAQSLPEGLEIETAVLEGEVAPALAADAKSCGAQMLLVGCDAQGLASGKGCSTAVSLALDAGVPILALDVGVSFTTRDAALTVLVADDLTSGSLGALALGAALAGASMGGRFVHVHVAAIDDADGVDSVLTTAEAEMNDRVAPHRARFDERACRYRREILVGSVPRALEEAAAAARADLVVCGVHLMYHRDARRPGQLPFRAMMGQRRPVVVVPV